MRPPQRPGLCTGVACHDGCMPHEPLTASPAGVPAAGAADYYRGREDLLSRVFGADVTVDADHVVVGGRRLPVEGDVIIALDASKRPGTRDAGTGDAAYAPDIQATFGAEWQAFDQVLPEHRDEFAQYFDLVDLSELGGKLVADLGCGAGRYASLIAPHVGDLVVVDFSEAVFVARRNLAGTRAVFVMGDVLDLPFPDDAFDLVYSLGVLHHLPVDALDAVRSVRRLAPRVLVYLYYALDNRPAYYRELLRVVTSVRLVLARIRSERARAAVTSAIAGAVYWPLARLGQLLAPVRLDSNVPLADFYRGKSWQRLRQDAYDRFFTRIEQRVTRAQIEELRDEQWQVRVSDGLPYWHFLHERRTSSAPAADARTSAA